MKISRYAKVYKQLCIPKNTDRYTRFSVVKSTWTFAQPHFRHTHTHTKKKTHKNNSVRQNQKQKNTNKKDYSKNVSRVIMVNELG